MKLNMNAGLLVLSLGLSVAVTAKETLKQGEWQENDEVVVEVVNGLLATLELKDGTREDNKNFRFTKASFQRGTDGFHMWCHELRGLSMAESQGETVSLDCALGATTVSHDDDESLLFTITDRKEKAAPREGFPWLWKKTANVEYYGDGTFLGRQADVLLGPDYDELDRTYPLLGETGTDLTKDPLALGHAVQAELNKLLAEQVYIHESNDLRTPIKVRWGMDKTMNLHVTVGAKVLRDTYIEQTVQGVSILAEAGNLESGYALDQVVERVKAAFAASATQN